MRAGEIRHVRSLRIHCFIYAFLTFLLAISRARRVLPYRTVQKMETPRQAEVRYIQCMMFVWPSFIAHFACMYIMYVRTYKPFFAVVCCVWFLDGITLRAFTTATATETARRLRPVFMYWICVYIPVHVLWQTVCSRRYHRHHLHHRRDVLRHVRFVGQLGRNSAPRSPHAIVLCE